MIDVNKIAPEVGLEVIGHSPEWIHADFNPRGFRACVLTEDGWMSADWNPVQDEWVTDYSGTPTLWLPYPEAKESVDEGTARGYRNPPGVLEVGATAKGEVVLNLPTDMTGHIVFSPEQAEHLAGVLTRQAGEARTINGPPHTV